MSRQSSWPVIFVLGLIILTAAVIPAFPQTRKPLKAFMTTDMEGVDGIFDFELQCNPQKSPLWEASHKLLTDEVNAAVKGLYEGGATDVFVYDGHDSSRSLSVLDIEPRAHLLEGSPISSTAELDDSFGAFVFIGQHAMAGAEKGVLSHTESFEYQNLWVNGRPTGEIGLFVMMAGQLGVPVIMLSGDTAACREVHELVPDAECAEVKTGVSRTAAWMLSHPAACDLIHDTARRAMQRLPQIRPYKLAGPVEVRVEYTPQGTPLIPPREGIERLNERTWVFRGKDIIEVCSNFYPLLNCH